MWIGGLLELRKPLLHLHTQYNRDIPWSSIDMDFMNLNQSAHGDREFGFIATRLKTARKIVVGFWQAPDVVSDIAKWTQVAVSWAESQSLKVARFGDNMREVAVTEGDKVEAQAKFGWSINGYGVGDLVKVIDGFSDAEVETLLAEYAELYDFAPGLAEPAPDEIQSRCKRGSSSDCERSCRRAASAPSQQRLKICMALHSFPALPCSV